MAPAGALAAGAASAACLAPATETRNGRRNCKREAAPGAGWAAGHPGGLSNPWGLMCFYDNCNECFLEGKGAQLDNYDVSRWMDEYLWETGTGHDY